MGISQADIDELFGKESAPPPVNPSAPAFRSSANAGSPSQSHGTATRDAPRTDIRRILGLSVPVSVILAERDMCIEMILATKVGTIIEFDVPFDAELTLQVANQAIGGGYAVKVGENFGLRVTRTGSIAERVEAMGNGSSRG